MKDVRTIPGIWDPAGKIALPEMNSRIRYATLNLGWQEAVRIILRKGIPISELNVAEAGCGSATMALTFALMGASVSLIDFNQKVLEHTRDLYQLYGTEAEYINEDCINNPSERIRGNYDLVISSGLLEHFSGKYKKACLNYHKQLLNKDGFVFISVPNSRSPWYRVIRSLRVLTGTWKIDLEIPLSAKELKKLAEEAGLSDSYVIAYSRWLDDFKDYFWGFFSAIGEALPKTIKKPFKEWKLSLIGKTGTGTVKSADEMREFCADRALSIKNDARGRKMRQGFLWGLNSGLVLFAFNSSEPK